MHFFRMKEPTHPRERQRLRKIGIACFTATVFSFGTGPAPACDGIKDSVKKTEQGFGELLKGVGQEVKKAGEVAGVWPKAKEEPKRTEKQTDKGKEDHK